MNRPPVWMHMRIKNENKNFGIWLPLFLLWPLALVVMLILSPLIIIGVLVLWPTGWGRWAIRVLKAAWGISCGLKGLKVDINNPRRGETVYISIV